MVNLPDLAKDEKITKKTKRQKRQRRSKTKECNGFILQTHGARGST
jgi:hypothetical protein